MEALCMGQLVSLTYRCWILYTTRALGFVLEHLELLLWRAYMLMQTNYLQYASKMKSLPKHIAHDAVFDNKYMKLFDARPNAIHTLAFAITFNIDFSDILERPSYFVLPPWCIKPPNIVLHLVYLKKDHTDAYVYQQLFMEIREVPWLYSCLYRWFMGWEFCGLCYNFSTKHHNYPEITWFSIHIYHWNLGNQ